MTGSTTEPEMSADDVCAFLDQLDAHGIRIWLDGGWAVDACLGSQTRRHGDLDIVIEERDVGRGTYGPPENGEYYPAEAPTGKGTVRGGSWRASRRIGWCDSTLVTT
jgi:Aminoglycoside-2''-adenylyltransferase